MRPLHLDRDKEQEKNYALVDECIKTAKLSPCLKLRYGAIAEYVKNKQDKYLIAQQFNRPIPATQFMCPDGECVRLNIPSRTLSLIGGCCHAEELVLWEMAYQLTFTRGYARKVIIYTLGIDNKDVVLYKTKPEFTCLRCAIQMAMAGIKGVAVWLPDEEQWHLIAPEQAVKQAYEYYTRNIDFEEKLQRPNDFPF